MLPTAADVLTLGVYSDVFTQIGLVTLGVTAVMALTVPVLNRLINKQDDAEAEVEAEAVLEK